MKFFQWLSLSTVFGMFFFSGCAPSVSVTPAGQDRQYEVSVSSNEFSVSDTNELITLWHEKAREACNGGNYKVITRDVIQKSEPVEETLMTGIIECE